MTLLNKFPSNHNRMAIATVTIKTIHVKLRASSRVGQVVLRSSARASRKYSASRFGFFSVSALLTLVFSLTIEDTA